ncbi:MULTISPECIES: CARDB domain-containing protein [Leptolyngbya]|uniref:CARDB domain-containing protein n=1 Tax=Leptolyngbya TaxID=47251 RepID=UPI00168461B5|nr:CARDB domain-containing protein [Leptolyngbya sp. FACHB-1624]MBD1857952.1 hypothetical protein [Leptolyngbya sp. FACHB-1624]
MKRHLLIALSSVAALSMSAINAIAATPNPQPGCPDGWVPRPPELNPALGECMPGEIAPPSGGGILKKQLPDLKIRGYQFSERAPQSVRVQIINQGNTIAKPSNLRLTVTQIKGVKVNRMLEVQLPAFKPHQSSNFLVNASEILPSDVDLKDTTFRLKADATLLVNESDESDNVALHHP